MRFRALRPHRVQRASANSRRICFHETRRSRWMPVLIVLACSDGECCRCSQATIETALRERSFSGMDERHVRAAFPTPLPFAVGDLEVALAAIALVAALDDHRCVAARAFALCARCNRAPRSFTARGVCGRHRARASICLWALELPACTGGRTRRLSIAARVTAANVSAFADRIATQSSMTTSCPAHERMQHRRPMAADARASSRAIFVPVVDAPRRHVERCASPFPRRRSPIASTRWRVSADSTIRTPSRRCSMRRSLPFEIAARARARVVACGRLRR